MKKTGFFRMLMIPSLILFVGGICLGMMTHFITEPVKIKTVWVAIAGILILVTVLFFFYHLYLMLSIRMVFRKDFTAEGLTSQLIRRMAAIPRRLYIFSLSFFVLAPALYTALQFLRKTPPAMGSVAIVTFCSMGLGIIVGNMIHLYLTPRIISIGERLSSEIRRIQLKHKIILPVINMVLVLLIVLSLFAYISARNIFSPAGMERNFFHFKYQLQRITDDYADAGGKDINAYYIERLKADEALNPDFYFILNGKGHVLDSSFRDTVGLNALTDLEKDWKITAHFRENVEGLLGGAEGTAPVYFRRFVFYTFYHPIKNTDLFIMSGVLSNRFLESINDLAGAMVIIGWIFLIMITVYSLYETSKKFRPLLEAARFLERISQGDMTSRKVEVSYESGDEISYMIRALENMAEIFYEITRNLKLATVDLVEMANNIRATSREVSDDNQTQASTIEEFSASVEEITTSIEMIAKNVNTQYQKTDEVFHSIEKFDLSMKKILENTEQAEQVAEVSYQNVAEIEGNITATVEEIKSIEESSLKVADTLSVIKDISDQINLLSLNASIEAARAGDAGRGFAVVADEVGKLAERTNTEAKQIETLILESGRRVNEGIEVIRQISDSIHKMMDSVRNTSDIIVGIAFHSKSFVDDVGKVFMEVKSLTDLSNENAVATEEQLHTTKEVIAAIDQMNKSVQKTTLSVQGYMSIVDKLSAHASRISRLMENIRI